MPHEGHDRRFLGELDQLFRVGMARLEIQHHAVNFIRDMQDSGWQKISMGEIVGDGLMENMYDAGPTISKRDPRR
jgi:hypothetical protein